MVEIIAKFSPGGKSLGANSPWGDNPGGISLGEWPGEIINLGVNSLRGNFLIGRISCGDFSSGKSSGDTSPGFNHPQTACPNSGAGRH